MLKSKQKQAKSKPIAADGVPDSGKPKKQTKILFGLLNSVLSVLLFVSVYKFWIEKNYTDNTVTYFLYTLAFMLLTGWFANGITRIMLKYWETQFTFHAFNRTLLHCLIYTVLLVTGFITHIFNEYPLTLVCVILIAIKVILFITTDYFLFKVGGLK